MKLCGYDVGLDRPFFLIAGPCVVESRQLQVDVAGELKSICADLEIPFIFKSSYDKANRTSHASYRGPGREEGLRVLGDVKRHVEVPVLTDVHVIDGTVNGAGWITRLSGNISKWWDTWIIDGVFVNGPAIGARMLSYPARLLQYLKPELELVLNRLGTV